MESFFLSNGKINREYTITGMCSFIDIKTRTRLYELGFFDGEKVLIISKSLMGGVLLVQIRNSVLTLRQKEASCVVVK